MDTDKVVPVHSIRTRRSNWGIAPFILNLSTWWMLVVSFMSWLLGPAKEPQYPLSGGWVGPVVGLDNLKERKIFPAAFGTPDYPFSSIIVISQCLTIVDRETRVECIWNWTFDHMNASTVHCGQTTSVVSCRVVQLLVHCVRIMRII